MTCLVRSMQLGIFMSLRNATLPLYSIQNFPAINLKGNMMSRRTRTSEYETKPESCQSVSVHRLSKRLTRANQY
jgi:hypothetical protein